MLTNFHVIALGADLQAGTPQTARRRRGARRGALRGPRAAARGGAGGPQGDPARASGGRSAGRPGGRARLSRERVGRAIAHVHGRRRLVGAHAPAAIRRPTSRTSPTSCRPTPRSARATPVGRWWAPAAASWASTRSSSPAAPTNPAATRATPSASTASATCCRTSVMAARAPGSAPGCSRRRRESCAARACPAGMLVTGAHDGTTAEKLRLEEVLLTAIDGKARVARRSPATAEPSATSSSGDDARHDRARRAWPQAPDGERRVRLAGRLGDFEEERLVGRQAGADAALQLRVDLGDAALGDARAPRRSPSASGP